MKTFSKNVIVLSAFVLLLATAGCFSSGSGSSDGGGSTTTTHQYLVIPNAVFVAGTPSASPPATTQKPRVTPPANTTYTLNQTVTWTVNFTEVTEITEITDVIIEITELDGYFDYPLTPEEIAAGEVLIDTQLVAQEPTTTQICNRDYRGNGTCYEKADTGVTSMDFGVAHTDPVAPPIAGDSFSDYTVDYATIEVVDDGSGDGGGGSGGGGTTGATCSGWTTMCSCNFRACSNGESSWYDVGTGVYYCASVTNCTSAAQQAVDWCTRGC